MGSKKTKVSIKTTIGQTIKDAGFGWLGTVADLSLVTLVLGIAGMGANPRNAEKIVEETGKLFTSLRQKRLQKSLRSSLYHLSELGWRKEWKITILRPAPGTVGYIWLFTIFPKTFAGRGRNYESGCKN